MVDFILLLIAVGLLVYASTERKIGAFRGLHPGWLGLAVFVFAMLLRGY